MNEGKRELDLSEEELERKEEQGEAVSERYILFTQHMLMISLLVP